MTTATAIKNDTARLSGIVNLTDYPINDINHPLRAELVDSCREALDRSGCMVIENFIQPSSLDRMRQEAERLMSKTYWSNSEHNPYFTKDDSSLPADHPKRFFEKRTSGYINSDVLEQHSDLRAIYQSQQMLDFVGDCLNVSPIYCWADPLACNPYSVMDDNHYFPWHFDGNEFTLSILVQAAEQGGVFEYAPALRARDDENFDAVKKVLTGDRARVHELDLRPGDLQLFKGRFSLHRVTRVSGSKKRIIALPTYVTNPYYVNPPAHSKHLYGRAMQIHYDRQKHQPDNLIT